MNKYALLILIGLLSCCSSSPNKTTGDPGPYFDLNEWLDGVFIGQETTQPVHKTLMVDHETEERQIQDYDIIKDLEDWRKLDWNQVQKYGTYSVDTNFINEKNWTVHYSSVSKSNTVTQAVISVKNDTIRTVQVLSDRHSALSSSRKEYILELHQGYTMRLCDTLFWSTGHCSLVDIEFL